MTQLSQIEQCLQEAAERSGVRALLQHPELSGVWTVSLDGASVLHVEWEAHRHRLSMWSGLGPVADEHGRHAVHALLAHFSAAYKHFRIGLGDEDIYELFGHWHIDPQRPQDLATLFDDIAAVVKTWRQILACPPTPHPAGGALQEPAPGDLGPSLMP